MTQSASLVPRSFIIVTLLAILSFQGWAVANQDWKTVLILLPAVIFIIGGDLTAMAVLARAARGTPEPPTAPPIAPPPPPPPASSGPSLAKDSP